MKVYITRDEGCDWIWLWKKPSKGNWAPYKKPNCSMVVWERGGSDLEETDAYTDTGFKKKFGITIMEKTKKCVHLPDKLVNSEDYKLFSDDPKRKRY